MSELDMVKRKGNENIFPGQRVEVYDPLDGTFQKGTVVKRYCLTEHHSKTAPWRYPDLVDVKEDRVRMAHYTDEWRHVSRGHFTYGVKKI